jgi:DNA mismatch endonuclease (patch repair protein)
MKSMSAQRSALMSRVRSKHSKPELEVRRTLHAMGFRFRLHSRHLPGTPDIVLPGRRKVIFVHGCFWHGHAGCRGGVEPKSNINFWRPKLEANRQRDSRNQTLLAQAGWSVLVIWQCELKRKDALRTKLKRFLDPNMSGL